MATFALTLPTACTPDGAPELESPVFVTVDSLEGAEIEITQHQPLVIPQQS